MEQIFLYNIQSIVWNKGTECFTFRIYFNFINVTQEVLNLSTENRKQKNEMAGGN